MHAIFNGKSKLFSCKGQEKVSANFFRMDSQKPFSDILELTVALSKTLLYVGLQYYSANKRAENTGF